jgi:hypothetical protein
MKPRAGWRRPPRFEVCDLRFFPGVGLLSRSAPRTQHPTHWKRRPRRTEVCASLRLRRLRSFLSAGADLPHPRWAAWRQSSGLISAPARRDESRIDRGKRAHTYALFAFVCGSSIGHFAISASPQIRGRGSAGMVMRSTGRPLGVMGVRRPTDSRSLRHPSSCPLDPGPSSGTVVPKPSAPNSS